MSLPSEENYLMKYSSGTILTTSGSGKHTDMPQSRSEESVLGVSRSPREIYTGVEEDPTSSLYCVGLKERRI